MQRNEVTPALAVALVGIGLLTAELVHARQTPPRPTAKPAQSVGTYGDVRIINAERTAGKADLSIVTFTGPDTIVEAPDKASHSLLHLHADTIILHKVGTDVAGTIEMNGHIRFRITQQTKNEGERILTGTAGHAFYARAKKRIELTEGVHATLEDKAQLDGPGTIQGERLDVDLSQPTSYRYLVNGPPSGNRIKFTPRENTPQKQGEKPKKQGEIRIHNYETGELQVGVSGVFHGPQTTLDYDNATDKTHAQFKAPEVTATFNEKDKTLEQAQATGVVHYTIQRPTPDGKNTQTIRGVAQRADYDAQTDDATLTGAVRATITDPSTLVGPAYARAARVFAHREQKGAETQYEMTGAANQTLLRFTPRPRPTPAAKPADANPAAANPSDAKPLLAQAPPAPPKPPETFPLGEVEITGFTKGDYDPEKSFSFTGAKTELDTADKEAKTRSRFQASHITGVFAPDHSIAHIEATGAVRFRAERPIPAAALAAEPQLKMHPLESAFGTAHKIDYENTADTNEIIAQGPFRVSVLDPVSLEGPGHIIGADGDTLRLNVAVSPYTFETISPRHTAVIDFQLRQKPAAPTDNKAKPTRKPKK